MKDFPGAKPHMAIVGWSNSKPAKIHESSICYLNEHKGGLNDWMRAFREEWYPAKYNAQFGL
jgi:hypothetical protein